MGPSIRRGPGTAMAQHTAQKKELTALNAQTLSEKVQHGTGAGRVETGRGHAAVFGNAEVTTAIANISGLHVICQAPFQVLYT